VPGVAAIVSAVAQVGGQAYSAISANQRSQYAKGINQNSINTAPTADETQQKAERDAAAAGAKQTQATANNKGYGSTLLTGNVPPMGAPLTNPRPGLGTSGQRSTLLGA